MRAKTSSPIPIATYLMAIGMVLGMCAVHLHAQSVGDSFVYVMTNKNPGNSVIQFQRGSNGVLTWLREVPTGGNGTGPNGADPLGSQDSLVLSGDGSFLLAVNAGSNEISVLGPRNGKLTWLSKTTSGGTFPNSIALSHDLVYVLNSKGASPNITGFRLDVNGVLHWIATIALPAGDAGANDIRFAPDGSELLVAVSGTNQILVFPLGNNGVASSPVIQTSAAAAPFGIRFGHNEVALIADASGAASSYQLSGADMLSPISGDVSDTQMATCWISVPREAKFALVSNTGSGTLSSFAIDANGDLTLAHAVAVNPGGAPIDSALSRDGKFLYVDESAQGKVLIFSVSGGNLAQIGSVTLQPGLQGIAAQ
jgi:6-phosphogluconolactonase